MPSALYRVSADEYLNNLSVVFGSIVSINEVGALYRVHGLNNYYQAIKLIDLVRIRQIIIRNAEFVVSKESFTSFCMLLTFEK
jgi:hypothetical protein